MNGTPHIQTLPSPRLTARSVLRDWTAWLAALEADDLPLTEASTAGDQRPPLRLIQGGL